jgi:hypothetical protein
MRARKNIKMRILHKKLVDEPECLLRVGSRLFTARQWNGSLRSVSLEITTAFYPGDASPDLVCDHALD